MVASAMGAMTRIAVTSNLQSRKGGSPTKEDAATPEKSRIALPSDSNVYRKVAYVDENTGELITLYEYNEKQNIRKEQEELQKQMKHGSLRRHFTKRMHRGK